MPPEARERLIQGADRLGCALSGSQADALMRYLGLLARWGRTYNLTAIREPARAVVIHLLDCLAIVPSIEARFAGRTFNVLDVGSGAGLPGVVLALMFGRAAVTSVDASAKKAAFVRQAAAELGLRNLQARHLRAETISGRHFDLITARAYGSLSDLVNATVGAIARGGAWAAMKGDVSDDELKNVAAAGSAEVFHVEQLHVPFLDARRSLVWMRPVVDTLSEG